MSEHTVFLQWSGFLLRISIQIFSPQNALSNGFNTELDGRRYAQNALEKGGRTRALTNDDHVLCVILCFCELQRTEDFTVFNLQM